MAYEKPYEHRPGKGSVFQNKDKKEDWQGDLTGKFMLPDGKLYYINAYNAVDKNGNAYFKLSLGKEVHVQAAQAYSAAHQPFPPPSEHEKAKSNGYAPISELDSDIPF